MKESAKCRSGRVLEQIVETLPPRRGGKSAHLFRNDKGVAAERDRDMMMPAHEGPSLEVIQTELAFDFLHPLGSPALLDDAHQLLVAHAAGRRREANLARSSSDLHSITIQTGSRFSIGTPSAWVVFTLQKENRPSSVAFVPSRQRSIDAIDGESS